MKPPEHPLPAQQAITVGSSLSFSVTFLHDWSNFDLPKLMPIEHIFFDAASCTSIGTHYGTINQEFAASAEMNTRAFLWHASVNLSPQSPSLFPFPTIPYPFRRLLRSLLH